MSDYGTSDTSTTTLGANQFPISEVYPPSGSLTPAAGGTLTALEGGPASTDSASPAKRSAPASIYVKDGNDLTQGLTTDAAVVSDANGTLSGKLRGLVKILADVWDSVNHHLKVDGSGVTQPVSGSVTANAGTNLNTSLLALEAGGHLASVDISMTAVNTVTGAKGDAAATDNTSSWSVIALLKGVLGRLLTSIAVTGTFWQSTQPVSMSTLIAQAGEVALYGSNPAALTANTDAAIKWGAGGTTAVNHLTIANNTTINVNYRLDAATTAGSDLLAPGQKITVDIAGTLAVHVQANGTPNLNGSTGGNIVITAWL